MTAKQILEELQKNRNDKGHRVVKVEDRLTGEYYDVDEISRNEDRNELYLVVNSAAANTAADAEETGEAECSPE